MAKKYKLIIEDYNGNLRFEYYIDLDKAIIGYKHALSRYGTEKVRFTETTSSVR